MREDNPFEDEKIAQEWIASIEGERGKIRENELYPMLRKWSAPLRGTLLDIGVGQGICADYVQHPNITYIGIDPSKTLIDRANQKYPADNRTFVIGNAYDLPVENDSIDIVLSINVWFHLADLKTAAKEVSRVLKAEGIFLISTANPASYHCWEAMFDSDARVTEASIDGKINIPVQSLSRNLLLKHSLDDIVQSLEENGLSIDRIENFGNPEKYHPHGLFINIFGRK